MMEFVMQHDGHIYGKSDVIAHIYLKDALWHWTCLDSEGAENDQDSHANTSLQLSLDECYENATGNSRDEKPSWGLTLPDGNTLMRSNTLEATLTELGYVPSIQGVANLVMKLGPKVTKQDALACMMASLTTDEGASLIDLRMDLQGLQTWMAELPFPLYGYVRPANAERSASLVLSDGALNMMSSALCVLPLEASWKTQIPMNVREAIETSGGVVVPMFFSRNR
jgi:hypothetical protein